MLIRAASAQRGVELGAYPLETLPRDPGLIDTEARRPALDIATANAPLHAPPNHLDHNHTPVALAAAATEHQRIFEAFLDGPCAPEQAPLPADLALRTKEIKGAAYYLDATHAGVCELPDAAWCSDTSKQDHTHALVVLVAHGRTPESNTLAHRWVDGAQSAIASMRATEIATCIAGHIRTLGYQALAHSCGASQVDMQRLAVLAGIAQRNSDHTLKSPFVSHFELAVVTCNYPMVRDLPLTRTARANAIRYFFGINGATSGRERQRQRRRASHLSRYPMERVRRCDRPTTLINDNEIPRVPQRANFFMRARAGDLGSKAQREVARFAFKHPLTHGMMGPLRALVPHQDDPQTTVQRPQLEDAKSNSNAVRTLAYHLGVDLVGICEVPRYAWYSHRPDGTPTQPYHKYAIVMLIDQGYDTMEGASGDDWISGCQSMRGYLRGAEIAGVMANFLRRQGVSARPQTNADSDVLHIPLVLLAGLGELSRIGELVLNPFVGPRFKSVVLTTDLPLIADQPIDFGLQEFCTSCLKCARECPVNAIPFGDKVMFNGYEIWKPDVERCTNYRVTNPKGSACGRCMKTCPLNKVVTADGALLHRLGSWIGLHTRTLKKWLIPRAIAWDDKLGYGTRNPVKRWWLDLEIVGDTVRKPRGTNERDLNVTRSVDGKKSPVGYYHAADMPSAQTTSPVPTNHRQAIERAALLETVAEAKARRANGGPPPDHYIPLTDITEQP